jgi:hypothetical protein
MPVSEAEVERVFSRMRYTFGDRSRRTGEDLMEARLVLEINDIRAKEQLSAQFEGMTGDLLGSKETRPLFRPQVAPFCYPEDGAVDLLVVEEEIAQVAARRLGRYARK